MMRENRTDPSNARASWTRTVKDQPATVSVPYHLRVSPPADVSRDSTPSLLTRARAGDEQALNDLFARYLPQLHRWASGRLPRWARDLADTPDLVQETLIRTFKKIEAFEYRGEGALLAYLRQAVMNRIRDELRRAQKRPEVTGLDERLLDDNLSPLEQAIGQQAIDKYESALGRVREEDRELIVARVELGMTYSEIAAAFGKSSFDAARMASSRALARLAEEMARGADRPD
jgi:RNA polymerase sigma-70 factor, ECF subfamily